MTITTSGSVITFSDATTQSTAATASIPSGSVVLFYQAAAPTGWTQVTTAALNDSTLRFVTGTGGTTGGTTAFSTVFANQTPTITTSGLSAGATTLTTAQMPSHTHTLNSVASTSYNPCGGSTAATSTGNSASLSNTGGGGSHTHSISGSATSSAITLNVTYANVIICSKN
jgi:hypothetical protein